MYQMSCPNSYLIIFSIHSPHLDRIHPARTMSNPGPSYGGSLQLGLGEFRTLVIAKMSMSKYDTVLQPLLEYLQSHTKNKGLGLIYLRDPKTMVRDTH